MIHCECSRCVNYWEDSCTLDMFEKKMITINSDHVCEDFKEGENELYQMEGTHERNQKSN
mgnify:CR=1 FL=1